jgi:NADPH:quinone reductase-like Zn-dependent oxidoreductase
MRALVYQPHHPGQLAFAEVPEPVPMSSQAVVQVHAVSLNFGEIAFLSEMRRAGQVLARQVPGKAVLDVRSEEAR